MRARAQAELRVLESNIREAHAVFQVLHHAKAEIPTEEARLLWTTTHCPQVTAARLACVVCANRHIEPN